MKQNTQKREIVLVLCDIRSVHNVGSIFRTADACGVSKIYLTGYTPAPIDRFGRQRKDLAKVALGGEMNVGWEQISSAEEVLQKLKEEKCYIVAVEQNINALDYKKIQVANKKVAFVFGNEVDGIPKNILEEVDVIAEIPMSGKKESLNVSVSVGIALFRILNQ